MRAPPAEGARRHLPGLFLATAGRRAHEVAARVIRPSGTRVLTWAEAERAVRLRAAGLMDRGVGSGDRVLLVLPTGLEAALCELAVHLAGAVAVPVFPSASAESWAAVAADAGAEVALAAGDRADLLAEAAGPGTIIRVGEGGPDTADLEAAGSALLGRTPDALDVRLAELSAGDPATLLYPSGALGRPRGVEHAHAAWVAQAEAVARIRLLRADDETFFFLPVAHAFGQLLHAVWLGVGMTVSFGTDPDRLADDLQAARPTVLVGVPRLFERLHAEVVAEGLDLAGARGRVFSWGLETHRRRAAGGDDGGLAERALAGVARRAVLRPAGHRIRARLGGRVRRFVSGGAPLAGRTARFFEAAGLPVLECYGLTEAAGLVTVDRPDRHVAGTVGPPLPGVRLRIAEDGEILVKGPGVMTRRPDPTGAGRGERGRGRLGGARDRSGGETRVDREGWLHTGDLGVLADDGHLRLTGRKREVLVTSGGKRVEPGPIEARLETHPLIDRVVLTGDGRTFISALVTLDEESAMGWAEAQAVPFEGLEAFVRRPELLDEVRRAVDEVNGRLAAFERIERFAVLPRSLSESTGELGPEGGLRRRAIEARWSDVLEAFHAHEL